MLPGPGLVKVTGRPAVSGSAEAAMAPPPRDSATMLPDPANLGGQSRCFHDDPPIPAEARIAGSPPDSPW